MENKKLNLLEGDILKNLILLSAPLMATAFVQIAYNFVDIIWLGRLGTKEVAAVGTSGIFAWIATSIAAIARVGGNVFASQHYGAHEKEKLNDTIRNTLILGLILSLVYVIATQLFIDKFIGFYRLTDDVSQLAITYLRVFSIGFIFSSINMIFSGLYNSIGDSRSPFKKNAIGLIFNIILDPILMFGIGPIPKMGVLGAAIATSLSQLLVSLIFIWEIIKNKNEIYDGIIHGVFHAESLGEIFRMGFPAGMQSVIMATISLFLNRFVASYGATPLAVYTVGTNMESITWMTVEGVQAGIITFVGQNYGARKINRLREVIKKSILIVTCIGLFSTAILIGFRHSLFDIFLPGDRLAAYQGAWFLLILGTSQTFMSAELGASGVFHGLGLTKIPSITSIIFNLLRIPIALLLMPHLQFYGVWLAVTISSILKGLVLNFLLYKKYRSLC